MTEALSEARLALEHGDVPVGCVIVSDGKIISRSHNHREKENRACAHAEIEAITAANELLGTWRLSGCDMYVTLEPCSMCAGAIINSRISRVIFGAYDEKAGACGSVLDLFSYPLNHHPLIKGGFMENECSELLSGFFKKLRL